MSVEVNARLLEHSVREEMEQPATSAKTTSEAGDGKVQTNAVAQTKREADGASQPDAASSSSSNGRSGGGYSADCSSSDTSSAGDQGNGPSETTVKPSKANQGSSSSASKEMESKKAKADTTGKKTKSSAPPDSKQQGVGSSAALDSNDSRKASTHVSAQMGVLDDMIEQGRKLEAEPFVLSSVSYPQWNGVRVFHPMDPRIDLSTVGHLPNSNVPLSHVAPTSTGAGTAPPVPSAVPQNHDTTAATHSVDNYLNLMEAVRPFFSAYGIPPQLPTSPAEARPNEERKNNSDETQNQSSEGFTSFFTSTEKSNSSETNSDSKSSGNCPQGQQRESHAASSRDRGSPDESDNSSMVVLARVKRKHLSRQQANGPNGGGGGDNSNSSDTTNGAGLNEQRHEGENRNQRPSDAGSSSSSENLNGIQQGGAQVEQAHPPRQRIPMVSESSDSLRQTGGLSSTTNTGPSTSGSGSAGNTGSGSNQGSSGSGNDNQGSSGSGNDNEGKGSSGTDAKDEGDGNSNSDGTVQKNPSLQSKSDPAKLGSSPSSGSALKVAGQSGEIGPPEASREEKLINKKRKRMNMRREYEEQVHHQHASSESSSGYEELVLRPGKPVTLDAVLSFTKVARMVVQSTPPFLVVHANAAYTALTGIDSHSCIGKPVRTIISLPSLSTSKAKPDHQDATNQGDSLSSHSTLPGHAAQKQSSQDGGDSGPNRPLELSHDAAEAAGIARANAHDIMEMNIERIIAGSGFGLYHIVNVTAKAHFLLGRKVAFYRQNDEAINPSEHAAAPSKGGRKASSPGNEQGSNSSTLPSSEVPFHVVPCRMSVSPVVSSPNALDQHTNVVTDQDKEKHQPSSKRRKHHYHHHHHHRKHPGLKNSLVTHYVIQFELVSKSAQADLKHPPQLAGGVSYDQSAEAPADVEGAYEDLEEQEGDEDEEDETESTGPEEAVTAIG